MDQIKRRACVLVASGLLLGACSANKRRAPGCGGLDMYKGGKLVSTELAATAFFLKRTPRLLLLTHNEAQYGSLTSVDLLTGSTRILEGGVVNLAWLGADETNIVVTRQGLSPSAHVLAVHNLINSTRTEFATGVCRAFPAPDGDHIYFIANCATKPLDGISTLIGSLKRASLATATVTTIANGVSNDALGIGKDGRRVAFLADYGKGCRPDAGTLMEWSETAGVRTVGSNVDRTYRARYLANGDLLYEEQSCAGSVNTLKVWRNGASTVLTTNRDFTGNEKFYYRGERDYQVSLDDKFVLAADKCKPSSGGTVTPLTLYAVAIDGSGETAIARDLYPTNLESGPDWGYVFTPDGKYVLYKAVGSAARPPRLSSLVSGTWQPNFTIDPFDTYWALMPETNEVVYGEVAPLPTSAAPLYSASLETKTKQLLAKPPDWVANVLALPGARGILYSSAVPSWNACRITLKSGVEESIDLCSTSVPGAVDPLGCLFAFNRRNAPGTFVALIPQE